MIKESKLEFKVGAFVLLALIVLTVFIFSINDSAVFVKGKTMRIIFDFADGLKKSAPVRMAGVDEGLVKDIHLFFDRQDSKTKAEVQIRVGKDTKIPSDSVVMINQLGLLGEKYIEIVPGLDTKSFYEDGQVIIGKDPVSQVEISEKIMDVVKKFDKTVGGVSQIMGNENNIESISKTLSNLSMLTGNLADISKNIHEGKGTVGRLFYDDRLYDDLEGFAADLKANPWKLLYRPKAQ